MKPSGLRGSIPCAVVLMVACALLLFTACSGTLAPQTDAPYSSPSVSAKATPSAPIKAVYNPPRLYSNDFNGEALTGTDETGKVYIAVNITLNDTNEAKTIEIYFLKRNNNGKISELEEYLVHKAAMTDGKFQSSFAGGNGILKGKHNGDLITCEIIWSARLGLIKAGTYNLTAQVGNRGYYFVQVIRTFAPVPTIKTWVPPVIK